MGKLIALLLLLPCLAFGQTVGDYRTDQTGNWTTATTWQVFVGGSFQNLELAGAGIYQNVIPSTSAVPATGLITISNNVTVSSAITADEVTVTANTTTISGAGVLTIADGSGDDLTLSGGAVSVTTGSLVFASGATYNHARNGGTIPLATWNAGSTCLVTGIVGTSPTLNAASSYQNFTWNCPGQTATITLASNLRDVNVDLNIEDTNNQQLRFGTAAAYTLNIDGDFNVTGNSRIAFGTTVVGAIINLLGAFDFSSTAATASLLKSSGSYTFNVTGGFSVSSGLLTMSTGNNAGTVNIGGDFTQLPSTITETGGGSGLFVFNGGASQSLNTTGTITNAINFQMSNAAGVVLNSDVNFPGALTQTTGNIDLNNKIITINGNFSQTSGSLVISPSVELIFQGAGTFPVSTSFSGTDLLRLELNRVGTFTTGSNFTVTTLNLLNGTLTHTGTLTIADGGTIERRSGSITNAPAAANVYNVLYSNTVAINTGPELPTSATALNNLTKQGAGTATLNQALVTINGNLNTIAAGGTFAMAANSISLAGNFTSNAALTATTASASTFTITGNCTLTGATTPQFNNLTVSGTLTPDATTFNASYRVNGNYNVTGTVNAGTAGLGTRTVTFGGTTVVTNSGTMNLNNVTFGAGANTMTAPVTTMGIAGNFTSNGVFNNGGGTILFNGTTILSAAESYNNITVTGTVTSAGNFDQTIAGNIINNGSLSLGIGDFLWTGSGTLSGSGPTTVGDVNVTGTFTSTSSGNLTLNDDVLGAGSFNSSGSSGTVIFAGGTSAIAAGGTRTFRSILVNGTLTPAGTYTLTGVGGIAVAGTLNNGGTIVFGGTTQTISGAGSITFNAFTTNAGSTLTITPNITINGNLIGNGDISAAGTISFVGLTMSGAGVKSFTGVTVGAGTFTPNASYSIAGNLTVNGTLAAGNATTTFNGNTAISGVGGTTFDFLTITGTLTSSSGTISVVRDFTNNGSFNHNGGTVSFSTAGAVQQQILGSNSIVFNNLTINAVGAVAVDVTNGISGGQTVDIAGALSFGEANAVLDADGAGAAVLRFLSTNDSPATDGRIAAITFAGSNITGNFTVQRFVSSENRIYRYIAAPVVGATVAQLKAAIPVTGTFTDPSNGSSTPPCTVPCMTASPSLFSYDESTQAYLTFPANGQSSATMFANGRGYSAFFRHTGSGGVGQVNINFIGTNPSTAGVGLLVSPTSSGFSLVGNPYPSPIVWNNGAGWTKTNIADVIVVRDNATGLHQSYSAAAGTGIIAAGQSFWVQSSAGGAALSINENAKTSGSYSFFKTSEPIIDQLELLLTKSSTGTTDNARITLVNGSLQSNDVFDGVKFDNSIDDGSVVTQVHDISTFSSGSRLAVNAVPTVCSQTFTVNMRDVLNSGETSMNYDFTINASGALKSSGWTLHDNKTNTDIDLTLNPVYSFTVDAIETQQVPIPGSSPAAYRYHLPSRFLLLKAAPPALIISGSVTTSPSVCEGSEAVLTVASQNGFTYGVEVNGTDFYPNVAQGDGGDINIFIESAWLTAPTNNIRIKASSGCDSQFLTTTSQITKELLYAAAGVSAESCVASSVVLSATGDPAASGYHWYESETSSTILATGGQFTTPVLSDTTTYYVSAINSLGCDGPRVPVTAYINDLSSQFTVEASDAIVCRNSTITFTSSTGLTGTYKWYETATSVDVLSANPEFTTPPLTKTSTYYVSFTNGSACEGSRKEVTASISNFGPVLWADDGLSGKQICPDGSYTLVANGAPVNSTYAWFEAIDSSSPIVESTNFITPALATSRNYYLAAKNELGCFTDRYLVETAVDSSEPAENFTFTYDKICKNDVTNVKLSSTDPNATAFRWYESASSEVMLKEGLEYTTDYLGDDQSYFVAAVNANGCEGSVRKEVKVTVTKFPDPVIESGDGLLKSNFVSGNEWFYDEDVLGSEKEQVLTVTKPGLYNLKVSFEGCIDWASSVLKTDFVTGLEDEVRTIELYPNPASEVLSIRVSSIEPVRGEFFDERGIQVLPIYLKQDSDTWKADLDVRSISKGLYFLRLSSGAKSITHKVIIK